MKRRNLIVAAFAVLISISGCVSRLDTFSEQPKDTVVVHLKDGHRAEFPASSVTKVVYRSSPAPQEPPRQHVLVHVSGEQAGRLVDPGELNEVRVDRTVTNSEAWVKTIAMSKEIPAVRSGHGQVTLMRVVLDGDLSDDTIQLSSIKLNDPWEAKMGGGGMFRQVGNGDFILVEHIGSTRRRQGKDPVEIGTFMHHRSTLWVEAPPAGTLGVLGDVVLSACPKREMGRLRVTVLNEAGESLEVRRFQIGPVAVGGPYGKTLPFAADHTCDSGQIAPGVYKVLLPDFDTVKSRWTVNVSPGNVTHLRFVARSQRQVDKLEEAITPDREIAKE